MNVPPVPKFLNPYVVILMTVVLSTATGILIGRTIEYSRIRDEAIRCYIDTHANRPDPGVVKSCQESEFLYQKRSP